MNNLAVPEPQYQMNSSTTGGEYRSGPLNKKQLRLRVDAWFKDETSLTLKIQKLPSAAAPSALAV